MPTRRLLLKSPLLLPLVPSARTAAAEQVVERLLALGFALDEVLRRAAAGEASWGRVRADAIGVAGHSFGAVTVQAVAGQRYPGVADLSDPRAKAFVALSPSLPVGVKLPPSPAGRD